MFRPSGRPSRPSPGSGKPSNATRNDQLVPRTPYVHRDEEKSVVERRFAAAAKPKIERLFSTVKPSESRFESFEHGHQPDNGSVFVRGRVDAIPIGGPSLAPAGPDDAMEYRVARIPARGRRKDGQHPLHLEDSIAITTQAAEQIMASNVTGETGSVHGLRRWLRRFSIRPSHKNGNDERKPRSLFRHRSGHINAVESPADDTMDSMTPSPGNATGLEIYSNEDDEDSTPWASGSWNQCTEDHIELRFCTNADSSDTETVYRVE